MSRPASVSLLDHLFAQSSLFCLCQAPEDGRTVKADRVALELEAPSAARFSYPAVR